MGNVLVIKIDAFVQFRMKLSRICINLLHLTNWKIKTKAIEVDFDSIKNLGISTEDNSQLPTTVQASLCIAQTPPQLP